MNLKDWINAQQRLFEKHANAKDAVPMMAYMKDQFAFLGIKSQQRRGLLREFLYEYGVPEDGDLGRVARGLWRLPFREFKYNAIDILRKPKRLDLKMLSLLEWMIVTDSWWDTVDAIADQLIGKRILFFHPELMRPKAEGWIETDNLWLQRSAIIFQMKFKEKLDERLLYDMILRRIEEKDFFIRKGIGWALREHAKLHPNSVKGFVETHKDRLSGLSIREALKHYN